MAKKKNEEQVEESDQSSVISDQFALSSESPSSPLAPLSLGEGKEYEEKSWTGKALYVCKTCTFDTFDEAAMLEHLIGAHNSESALKQFYEGKKE